MPGNVLLVRQGTKYGPEYVDLLKKQISRNAEASITVLGDGNDADRLLLRGWPGWWSKLELFAPWNAYLRPCLFLDLDTYVLGNIDDLVSFVPRRLTMLRDFNAPERGQSAIMSIPVDVDVIWKAFDADPEGQMRRFPGGDQAFLGQFPMDFYDFDGLMSYKVDRLEDAPRGRVINFHGRPKPHECGGWVRDIWDAR